MVGGICVGWHPDDEFTRVMKILVFQGKSISKCSWIWPWGPSTWVFVLGSSPCFFLEFFKLDSLWCYGWSRSDFTPLAETIVVIEIQVRKCLSVKHAPKSGVPKHDHYDHHTMPGAHRPPSRDPLHHAAPCLSQKRVGCFGLVFVRGKLGVFGNSAGWPFFEGWWVNSRDPNSKVSYFSDFQGLEAKSWWVTAWTTWVVSFSRKTGPEMQPPTYLANG